MPQHRRRPLTLLAMAMLVAVACSAERQQNARTRGAEASQRSEPTCRHTLPAATPDPEPLPPDAAHAPDAPSRVVATLSVSFARLKRELERGIPRQLARVRGADIGVAGTLNLTAERGGLSVALEGHKLVVRTTVTARAEACARGSCYATCDPSAALRAELPLQLDERYTFGRSRVTATITRGCKVRTLGGLLTVDLTPQLRQRIKPELSRAERDIDARLPKLAPLAERLFAELSRPRELPLVGCLMVHPRALEQGPIEADDKDLKLRFGLLAEPELGPSCTPVEPAPKAPPLRQNPDLGEQAELRLTLVTPLSRAESALRAASAEAAPELRVEAAHVRAAGSALDAALTLKGALCGELVLRARPSWSTDGSALTLAETRLSALDRDRLRSSGSGDSLLGALAASTRIAPPIDPRAVGAAVERLASAQSTDELDVQVSVTSERPLGAAVRDADLLGWVGLTGRLDLSPR